MNTIDCIGTIHVIREILDETPENNKMTHRAIKRELDRLENELQLDVHFKREEVD